MADYCSNQWLLLITAVISDYFWITVGLLFDPYKHMKLTIVATVQTQWSSNVWKFKGFQRFSKVLKPLKTFENMWKPLTTFESSKVWKYCFTIRKRQTFENLWKLLKTFENLWKPLKFQTFELSNVWTFKRLNFQRFEYCFGYSKNYRTGQRYRLL